MKERSRSNLWIIWTSRASAIKAKLNVFWDQNRVASQFASTCNCNSSFQTGIGGEVLMRLQKDSSCPWWGAADMARGKVKNGLRGSWLKHEKKKKKIQKKHDQNKKGSSKNTTFYLYCFGPQEFSTGFVGTFYIFFFFLQGEGANEMQMLYGGLSVIYWLKICNR